MEENLAAPARSEAAADAYRQRLAAIFRECRRVLHDDGRMVFTYHHRAARAWLALGRALLAGGFRVAGVAPMRGEGQGGLHSFAGTIKWDAVFVCVPSPFPPPASTDAWLSCHTCECMFETVEQYVARFARRPRVGFRAPDALNLYRALLVGHAAAEKPHSDAVSLKDALNAPVAFPGG